MANPIQKLALLTTVLVACSSPGNNEPATSPRELRIFTWSEYFDEEFLGRFSSKHGVKVKADYFSSNEEMLAKLQLLGSNAGYDLVLPSDYMVRNLIELKMLRGIDKAKLPALADFEKEALDPAYDPGLGFSVPLAIGSTGIAVNSKLLPRLKEPFSWKEMMESPEFRGKVTLLDDAKEVLQLALAVHGKSLHSASEGDVKEAFTYLKARKAQLKGFPPETRPVMEADECALCMAYSGDVLSVAKTKKEIRFVLPKEGATIWTDNLAIPVNARNPELAYLFINELLSPEGASAFTLRTNYRTANRKAIGLLPKEVSSNPIIHPGPSDRGKMHYLVQRKDLAALIDREWAALKSQ